MSTIDAPRHTAADTTTDTQLGEPAPAGAAVSESIGSTEGAPTLDVAARGQELRGGGGDSRRAARARRPSTWPRSASS